MHTLIFSVSIFLILSIVFGVFLAWKIYKLDKQNFLYKITALSTLFAVAVALIEHELSRQANYAVAFQLSGIHTIINSIAIFLAVVSLWTFTQPFPKAKYLHLNKILFSVNLLIISIIWVAELMGIHTVSEIHRAEITWQYVFQMDKILVKILVGWYALQVAASVFALWIFYQRRESGSIKKWVLSIMFLGALLFTGIFILFVFNGTQISKGLYFSSPALLLINVFYAHVYTNFKLFRIQPINALDNILESMYHAMIITDTNFKFTYLNHAARKELGIPQNDKVPNLTLAQIAQQFETVDWEKELAIIKQLPKGKKLVKEIELKHQGTSFFYQMNFSPVFSASNKKTGYLVMATNITALKKAATQLQQSNKELQETNTELERFVYIASHDLKSPLVNVINFLNLIQNRLDKQDTDKEMKQYTKFALTGAQQMNHLIEDVLEFSRLKPIPFSATDLVDLNEAVHNARQILQPIISTKNARIRVANLPTIVGETSQIQQLFQNLIENGIKYNKSKTPTISIESTIQKNSFQIIVTDNGIGINEAYQKKVFEMFKRLHTSQEYEGTGIGLAVCKKIMNQYSGDIQLTSEEGVGSRFILTFPKRFLKEHQVSSPIKKSDSNDFY